MTLSAFALGEPMIALGVEASPVSSSPPQDRRGHLFLGPGVAPEKAAGGRKPTQEPALPPHAARRWLRLRAGWKHAYGTKGK
jgi:hypothetical protein